MRLRIRELGFDGETINLGVTRKSRPESIHRDFRFLASKRRDIVYANGKDARYLCYAHINWQSPRAYEEKMSAVGGST